MQHMLVGSERRKTTFMQKCQFVTELIQCIQDYSEKYSGGTTHEDDWYFYHAALKQLTAKLAVRYMKEKGYYKRWLINQLGLNN